MSERHEFIIIVADDDSDMGVVAGREEAVNPETALTQLAKKVLDDEFLEILENENSATAQTLCKAARWLLVEEGKHLEIIHNDTEPVLFDDLHLV